MLVNRLNRNQSFNCLFTRANGGFQRWCATATAAARQMEVLAAAEATAPELEGMRLDAALPILFPGRWTSSSAVKKVVRRGEVLVNGGSSKTDRTLQRGDNVQLMTVVGCAKASSHFNRIKLREQRPGMDVAYEDDDFAVVVKPQGLLSQGPKGAASVAGRVKYCLQPTPSPGALAYPVIAHRLDVGTGGIMLVAKTRTAAVKLTRDLAGQKIQKRYLALVIGRLEGSGVIDHPISEIPSVSLFKAEAHWPSSTFGCLTLVSLWPKTGRTHQLRKHMAYIGHPILGDLQYKHHRKADCAATLCDINSRLPTFPGVRSHMHQQQQQQQEQGPQLQPEPASLTPSSTHCNTAGQSTTGAYSHHLQQQQQHHHLPSTQRQLACQDISSSPVQLAAIFPAEQQQQRTQCQAIIHRHDTVPPVYSGGGISHLNSKTRNCPNTAGVPVTDQGVTGKDPVGGSSGGTGGHSSLGGCSSAETSNTDQEGAQAEGCRQRGELLKDGTVVGTCLWAVQLQLQHPAGRGFLDISMQDTALRLFEHICSLDTA